MAAGGKNIKEIKMGWYGIFLVQKLKLAFSLRGISQDSLFSDFKLFDRFFNKYDKIREDINYIQWYRFSKIREKRMENYKRRIK